MTAYWQIWAASSLADRRDNARLVYRQLQIRRGLILASNGKTVLARNHPVRKDGLTLYTRRYPFGPLFAHAVGYNTVGDGRTALELAENPYLTASNSNLATVISNLGSTLRGETVTGDNVVTSLSVAAQKAAQEGASTASSWSARWSRSSRAPAASWRCTPRRASTRPRSSRTSRTSARGGGAPLLNRATQGLYAPGSTFKIVTATGALERRVHAAAAHVRRRRPLHHRRGATRSATPAPRASARSTLSTALTNSVNTYFAQLGQKLGQARLEATMQKFGFFQLPPFTYPTDEMNPSGLYANGRLIGPNAPIDVGRVAIGQERLAVTPLQMAEVAATVANDGVRMAPTPGGQGRHPVRRTRSTRASRSRSSG